MWNNNSLIKNTQAVPLSPGLGLGGVRPAFVGCQQKKKKEEAFKHHSNRSLHKTVNNVPLVIVPALMFK